MTTKMTKTSFATDYARLEQLIAWFETDEFDLDEADLKFNEASKLIAKLETQLQEAELKVEKLEKTLDKD